MSQKTTMEEELEYVPYITPAERKRQSLLQKKRKLHDNESEQVETKVDSIETKEKQQESLLNIAKRIREENKLDPQKKIKEEEDRVLESALAHSSQALISAKEKANDIKFKEKIIRKWKSLETVKMEPWLIETISKLVLVSGNNIHPPITTFEGMNLPSELVQYLKEKLKIETPTPIQMQGLPIVLSGRDMIGVASTGSGKTLTFVIPSIVLSLELLKEQKLNAMEGPFVIILGPARDLQRQTFQIVEDICKSVFKNEITCTLAIGGENKFEQLKQHRQKGTCILIGTPGRVIDFLSSSKMNLKRCSLLILDEGDRMMDENFDEEVKKIIGYFNEQPRQTVLFSATMPRRVVDFARDALLDAVVVNVGRAGAASSNITQYIENVKKEKKFVKLLECLQRTAPPVLIFSTKNSDVDDVHEYLLLKGIQARGIHAGKSQQERNEAVDEFKTGLVDVLVASEVGAKGLDFPQIAHVINFDLPSEIESYVHRIGRTGRGGRSGMATTFVDVSSESVSVLADLAAILRDAKQEIPSFLLNGLGFDLPSITNEETDGDPTACGVCGAFGHRITACPRLSALGRKNLTRDVVTGGDY